MAKKETTNTHNRNRLELLRLPFLILLGFVMLTKIVNAQGPAQPEAMQFEPVDASDVVNLHTGDFVYTIPLISVPGPEGN